MKQNIFHLKDIFQFHSKSVTYFTLQTMVQFFNSPEGECIPIKNDSRRGSRWLVERESSPCFVISDPFFPLRKKDVIRRDLLDEIFFPLFTEEELVIVGGGRDSMLKCGTRLGHAPRGNQIFGFIFYYLSNFFTTVFICRVAVVSLCRAVVVYVSLRSTGRHSGSRFWFECYISTVKLYYFDLLEIIMLLFSIPTSLQKLNNLQKNLKLAKTRLAEDVSVSILECITKLSVTTEYPLHCTNLIALIE